MTIAAAAAKPRTARLFWLDYLKAVAILWIFTNHVAERLFGFPLIANPSADWPGLQERLAQLAPFDGYGLLDVPLNLLRYVGWFGDQGVQLFIIASGFGLTWSLARGDKTLDIWQFYRKRTWRLFPMWWMAHLGLFVVAFLFPLGLVIDSNFVLSFFGIRFTDGTFYYLAASWWFIGLLIQFYLLYPVLWGLLQRFGALRFLLVTAGIAFAVRGIGLLTFEGYLDIWQRGGIFITRLPEFVFGMSLAVWLRQSPDVVDRFLRAPSTLWLALLGYALSIALSLTLLGMTFAVFVSGVSLFVLLYALFSSATTPQSNLERGLLWVGEHTYALYLVHFTVIVAFVPALVPSNVTRVLLGIIMALVGTVIAAIVLERLTAWVTDTLSHWAARHGWVQAALRGGLVVLLPVTIALSAELLVRRFDPQEVDGWGERPALTPHDTFGWTLKPETETRLRWESYDYLVTSNGLGFPGPDIPVERNPGTLRIMTVGDAFTSAEGVDTATAWPRLLEDELNAEVVNFGITGYGPNQYAAVVETFAPQVAPDILLIGFFVNEYEDVRWTNADFQQSIGFEQRPPDNLSSIVTLTHLRKFLNLNVYQPLMELINSQPRAHGYFLGHFSALEIDNPIWQDSPALVRERLETIQAAASDSEIILLLIPSSVQVCTADQLAYYPRHVDLTDTARYDLNLPQRTTQTIADALGLRTIDLRDVLNDDCYYQPRNMHWTAEGHQVVAAAIADIIGDS